MDLFFAQFFIAGTIENTLYLVLFFLFIAEVFIYPKITPSKEFKNELVSNVFVALLHNLGKLIFLPPLFLFYQKLYEHRVFSFSWNLVDFLIALILFDLCYYVHHYSMHNFSLLWAVHAVHHQPKYVNLSMSIRLSFFNKALTYWFYLPLAYLGIPTGLLAMVGFTNALYQIITHSRWLLLNDKLRLLFIDSRDHHSHHSKDFVCQNTNLGGMFSIWDYLFKTKNPAVTQSRSDAQFKAGAIEYGINGPEGEARVINNPIYANLYPIYRCIKR